LHSFGICNLCFSPSLSLLLNLVHHRGAGENSPAARQRTAAETAAQKCKSSWFSFAEPVWECCMPETNSWMCWLRLLLPDVECVTVFAALWFLTLSLC